MTPNGPKVREAIVHIIREADAAGQRITQFDILKTLFLADRAHFNRFGRPVTFDDYVAMPDGPVPSLAYDILKEAISALSEAEIEIPLWEVTPTEGKKRFFHSATRSASDDILSPSDFEELSKAAKQVRDWGYGRTWDYVHKDPAYIEAWSRRVGANSPMDYALLLDKPDREIADEIKFIAAHS